MTKTKLLLASVLAGAVAYGAACKTDKTAANANIEKAEETVDTIPDAGDGTGVGKPPNSGGSGYDPLPAEGERESEPGVHQSAPPDEPGTGGSGLEPEPLDKSDDLNEPMDPVDPSDEPAPEPQH
ncbi:hypothetical protein [Vitiosangium sp. GDMCC 1.1324]|uniref:hypothetical protein n=1 Tax=Vitiosangium sp. (strain GDMCC 1.1324) TaxID=2138576 RepID=UPI000D33F6F1|nr:hypothetical protein [Vitiosangium sp. GDMCC 1.1324]PTL79545.1 hypothetical protein DAT35_32540 [Vitiosangium sp. GDMCC 1.1324]